MLNVYDSGWINSLLTEPRVEDSTITDATVDTFDMDEEFFDGTSLETFTKSLLAIKENANDNIHAFVGALSEYLQIVKEK